MFHISKFKIRVVLCKCPYTERGKVSSKRWKLSWTKNQTKVAMWHNPTKSLTMLLSFKILPWGSKCFARQIIIFHEVEPHVRILPDSKWVYFCRNFIGFIMLSGHMDCNPSKWVELRDIVTAKIKNQIKQVSCVGQPNQVTIDAVLFLKIHT